MKRDLMNDAATPKLLNEFGNVIPMPERDEPTHEMPDRDPTSLELKLAKCMYNAQNETFWDDLPEDDIVRWIWIKTARFAIREMRALPYDITQKIRGKPFYDAKQIWETIIDAASPP